MAVLTYGLCRQQTYVVVCAGVTVLFLLIHYLSLNESTDGAGGRGTPAADDAQPAGRPMPAYGGQYEKASDMNVSPPGGGAASAFGSVGSLDRFVEGGRPLTSEEMTQRNAEWKVDQALKMSIDEGSVVARPGDMLGGGSEENGEGDRREGAEMDVSYLHCGPMHGLGVVGGARGSSGLRGMFDSAAQPPSKQPREILLLHGARFTKEDWRTSGILDSFCLMGKGEDEPSSLSVTAVDFPVEAGPVELVATVDALRRAGVLSPHPVFVVSPSASGDAVVGLGEMAVRGIPPKPEHVEATRKEDDRNVAVDSRNEYRDGPTRKESIGSSRKLSDLKEPVKRVTDLLRLTIRGWISVAAPAVLTASPFALRAFPGANVPVMAVFGAEDADGKKSAARLVVEAGAFRTKLEGGHACYLDGPDGFVRTVLGFVEDVCREQDEEER